MSKQLDTYYCCKASLCDLCPCDRPPHPQPAPDTVLSTESLSILVCLLEQSMHPSAGGSYSGGMAQWQCLGCGAKENEDREPRWMDFWL